MASVTIDKSYFEALLRRAEFHTSDLDLFGPHLSSTVVISKAEHERLLQTVRQYNLLKNALFRGGLTQSTLETLLQGEQDATLDDTTHANEAMERGNVSSASLSPLQHNKSSQDSRDTPHHNVRSRNTFPRMSSHDQCDPHDSPRDERDRVPVNDQRTIFIANLPEGVTHKDLVGIIRGGRLLDIFLRSDRTASVSFVEGAADFLAYAKRNDIYLQTKRLEFRWSDRQFHVPGHVSQKISGGATRNIVVRGGAGRLTSSQIRDHLDHIHNLIVVDVYFHKGDVYISTNSIHNALYARTCMMSRSVYKGMRVEFYADGCASPLPAPSMRTNSLPAQSVQKPRVSSNSYAVLDTGSDLESESDEDEYLAEGIRINRQSWAEAVLA